MKRLLFILSVVVTGFFVPAKTSDFPFGAFVIYNQAGHPNYLQAKNLGLNRLIMHVDDASGSMVHVDSFKNAGLQVFALNDVAGCVSITGWPLLYSEALYSKWEAEDTSITSGYGVGIRHCLNQPGTYACAPANVGRPDLGGTAWSVNPQQDSAGRVQNGPQYIQLASWPRQAQVRFQSDFLDAVPNYTVNFRLRADSIGGSDTICTISVSVIDLVNSPLRPETTIVSRVLTGNSFTHAGQFDTFLLTYNFSNWQGPPSSIRPAEPNMAGSTCPQNPSGSRKLVHFVQFNVDWTKKRKLYMDYTEVYDVLGRRLMVDPLLRAEAIDSIKSSVARLATQTISPGKPVVAGWYMVDEPGSDDFYRPTRFVDSLIRHVSESLGVSQYGLTVNTDPLLAQSFVRRTRPKVVALDNYPFFQSSDSLQTASVQNALNLQTSVLRHYAAAARDSGLPFHFIPQAFRFDPSPTWREVSTKELLAQIYLGLCYGAKGLAFWPYDSDPARGIIGLTRTYDSLTPKYTIIQQQG